jgi:hypothetical protein
MMVLSDATLGLGGGVGVTVVVLVVGAGDEPADVVPLEERDAAITMITMIKARMPPPISRPRLAPDLPGAGPYGPPGPNPTGGPGGGP